MTALAIEKCLAWAEIEWPEELETTEKARAELAQLNRIANMITGSPPPGMSWLELRKIYDSKIQALETELAQLRERLAKAEAEVRVWRELEYDSFRSYDNPTDPVKDRVQQFFRAANKAGVKGQ